MIYTTVDCFSGWTGVCTFGVCASEDGAFEACASEDGAFGVCTCEEDGVLGVLECDEDSVFVNQSGEFSFVLLAELDELEELEE